MRNFERPGRSAAYGSRGMAATSAPLATLAAIDTLRAGGNAADAAVVASAVLCVVEPAMTGIGGDCFALVGAPDGKVSGLSASGRSGLAADADWLKTSGLTGIALRSIHAITVPGAIDGWDQLLRKFGTMDLGEALKPAIRLAEEGVPVTPRVAWDWPEDTPFLAADEGGRIHCLKDGRAPRVGEIMHYPALARSMRLIGREGRDAFYRGAIAEDIVATVRARGSLLTMEDFAAHESTWVKPIATEFAGHEVLEIPPPGQGLTALIAMNVLSQFGLRRLAPDSVERHHLEIEAMKLAWELRNRHIADPDFHEAPVDELLSAKTAQKLAGMIDMNRALDFGTAMRSSGTVYLSVVDERRLAVSFINSVYDGFGSCVVTPGTGIALQNRGACFVTDPDHPNCIGPRKRPLHTIIPAMVRKDGLVDMSYGVMGGDYQPMGHITVAVNRYIHGMDPQEAIDWARYFPKEGKVQVESAVPEHVKKGLIEKGHALTSPRAPLGGGQAIAIDRDSGVLAGGSDPRKDGFALGY
ncbi:gamma-glutamyltransferase family protein [Aestuariivirga sp.]|uniref:gamma-glutamyltransferase family protein n=1 Tax=Aestuariivirga sp. TaxID=2650926 RepID=UPI0025BA82FB|nr:gamma-glutamyltransferase family protein [Aestuariivirga sp.]MCA3555923.1 gamma-glutamyltransferase family protein [Aestuariivirga sp.]